MNFFKKTLTCTTTMNDSELSICQIQCKKVIKLQASVFLESPSKRRKTISNNLSLTIKPKLKRPQLENYQLPVDLTSKSKEHLKTIKFTNVTHRQTVEHVQTERPFIKKTNSKQMVNSNLKVNILIIICLLN